MNSYITGKLIKELREKNKMTQQELANKINVSDKTISKWETAKGLPDISLINPLSKALNVSVIELMNGDYIINNNKSSNMLKNCFYICPICGNIITANGDSVISCCGVLLPKLETEEDTNNIIKIDTIENEYYVNVNHEMNKNHYISFIAYVTSDRIDIVKLYKEQNPDARFARYGHGIIYVYCNKDGLIARKL